MTNLGQPRTGYAVRWNQREGDLLRRARPASMDLGRGSGASGVVVVDDEVFVSGNVLFRFVRQQKEKSSEEKGKGRREGLTRD